MCGNCEGTHFRRSGALEKENSRTLCLVVELVLYRAIEANACCFQETPASGQLQ